MLRIKPIFLYLSFLASNLRLHRSFVRWNLPSLCRPLGAVGISQQMRPQLDDHLRKRLCYGPADALLSAAS